jgi:two-component system, LytTR family, sensor kinase
VAKAVLQAAIKNRNLYFYMMTAENIRKRLLRTALISSPIMAIYGVLPIYIFGKLPLKLVLFAACGLTANVLVFWLINMYVIRITKEGAQLSKRYFLSYLFTFIFNVLFILSGRQFNLIEVDAAQFIAYPFISVLAINTVILIISNSVLLAQKKRYAELEVERLKVSNLEAQKQVLIQQLQPHFLFNTLSVLKSLIRENPGEAENYSVKLSEFLRYSVQVHKSDLVTLEQELKFTNGYLELQQLRFGGSLICQVRIPAAVYHLHIPAYALQALVENAIKHNSFTEKKPLQIHIDYEAGTIKVWNNKTPAAADSPGTGLKNLNERYKIICGKEIEITENNSEFCVRVQLITI